jgi:hypothetical protein
VIGYGDVGKGSAQSLRQEGMIVRVTEIDPICAMQACMDGYEVVSPYLNGINTGKAADIDTRLLGETDLLVTTTGNTNVCDAAMLGALKNGAVVCNIGHFDTEIDTAYMREQLAVGRSEAAGAQGLPRPTRRWTRPARTTCCCCPKAAWSTWATPPATRRASWTAPSPTRCWRRCTCTSRSSPITPKP